MRRVKFDLTRRVYNSNENAAIGIGTLIIFIAMIMVAGMAASVIIQTMNNLEQQALSTGTETTRDVSSGVIVTQVNGYTDGNQFTQIAIFLKTIAGSEDLDLTYAYVTLSNTDKEVILNYTSDVFADSASNGLFGTVNSSNLTASTYGIIKIRDIDNSCTSSNPIINDEDLVVIMINTTKCFSGLAKRKEVSGNVVPEQGIRGVIRFTTPSALTKTIIELQT